MTNDIKQRIEQINRGEVPQGYKKTEVGIVPQEWEDKTIGQIGKFSKGKGIPGTEMKSEGLPCIGYGDIYTKYSYKFDKTYNFVDDEIAKESTKAEKGAIFFTCSGETAIEIGKCVCYTGDEPIYVGGDIAILKTNKQVDPLFLAYQQNIPASITKKAQYGQGHSVVHIYSDSLSKLCVAYPKELNEQQNIAKILAKWDEAIALQEKLIAKLEEQKKALMQKLLTPKEGWRSMPLGKIGEISSAGVDKKIIAGEKTVRLLNYMDVYKSMYLYDSTFTHTVTAAEDKVNKCDVKKYDIFFTPTSETQDDIAHSAVAMEDAKNVVYSYHVVRLRPQKKFNSLGLVAILQSWKFQKQAQKYAKGSGTRYVISLDDFRKIQISIPNSIELLEKIGVAFFSKTHEVELHVTKLQKLKQQQKALQQLLLTGIVRV